MCVTASEDLDYISPLRFRRQTDASQ